MDAAWETDIAGVEIAQGKQQSEKKDVKQCIETESRFGHMQIGKEKGTDEQTGDGRNAFLIHLAEYETPRFYFFSRSLNDHGKDRQDKQSKINSRMRYCQSAADDTGQDTDTHQHKSQQCSSQSKTDILGQSVIQKTENIFSVLFLQPRHI